MLWESLSPDKKVPFTANDYETRAICSLHNTTACTSLKMHLFAFILGFAKKITVWYKQMKMNYLFIRSFCGTRVGGNGPYSNGLSPQCHWRHMSYPPTTIWLSFLLARHACRIFIVSKLHCTYRLVLLKGVLCQHTVQFMANEYLGAWTKYVHT